MYLFRQAQCTPRAGVAKRLTLGPNSRLPGHWRAGYSAIYVIYAKIVKMYCSAIITIKSHHFLYTIYNVVALLPTVGNVVLEKHVQSIWRAGLN